MKNYKKYNLKILFYTLILITAAVLILFAGCSPAEKDKTDNTYNTGDSKNSDDSESLTATTDTDISEEIIPEEKEKFVEQPVEFPPAEDFDGIKFDENGRLIPTAYNKVQTFETGKTPSRYIYVSLTGSDSNDGSYENPYGSFTKALSEATPGTAVRIMPGTYYQGFYWDRGNLVGTEEEPIWIGGIPGMERPVFDGAMLMIIKGSYVIIHDMEVKNVEGDTGTGIHVTDGGGDTWPTDTHHFVFRNLYVHDITYQQFKFSGLSYYWVFDCEIARDVNGGSASIDGVGIHYGVIAYNYISDIVGVGIQLKGGSFEADIYSNLFVNAGARGINIGGSTGDLYFRPALVKDYSMYEGRYIRVYSNIFIDGGTPAAFVGSTDCYFVNNTVIRPKLFLFRVLNEDGEDNLKLANFGKPHGNTVSNNIFYFGNDLTGETINVGVPREDLKTFTVQNNLFYNADRISASKPAQIIEFSHEGTITREDPLFRDILNRDFNLSPESPAISAEMDIVLPFEINEDYHGDLFKTPRSIGAIQYTE